MSSSSRTSGALRDWLATVGLVAFVATPLLVQAGRALVADPSAEISSAEQRLRGRFPQWGWSARALRNYPGDFDAWYRDAFGLRDKLLGLHNKTLYGVFGVAPGDDTVANDNGWLFFTLYGELESFRGEQPLPASSKRAWQTWMETRRERLSQLGIASCFALAPFKSAVYPELVPTRFGPAGETRLDDLLGDLRAGSELAAVDLAGVMRAARPDWPGDWLYFPLGTHWTQIGAWEGARAILERLALEVPNIGQLARAEWESVPADGQGDSWAERLYLDGWLEQAYSRPRFLGGKLGSKRVSKKGGLEVWEHERTDLPKLVLIHDSFGDALIPFLAQGCSRLVATRDEWPVQLFEQQPDAVVYLRGEHVLVARPPDLNPLLEPAELEQRFAAGRAVWSLALSEGGGLPPGLLAEGQLELVNAGPAEGLVLSHQSHQDAFLTPQIAWPPGSLPALRAVLDCAEPGSFDVFYQTQGQPGFDARRGFRHRLQTGRNEFVLVLSAGGLEGPLRIRTSTRPGTTRILELELRGL